jgi:signal transduction histidine kinase
MQISKLLPFIIPGLLFQLFMQALFIARTVKDSSLTSAKRSIHALAIVIFGLPAISVRLFNAGKLQQGDLSRDEVETANHYSIKGIFLLLLVAYQVMGLHMLTENIQTQQFTLLIVLLTLSYLLMLLYNLLPEGKRAATGPLLPILQLLLCIPIQVIDRSGDNLFLSIIAGFSAINHASLSKAKIFGIASLGTYLIGSTARTIFFSVHTEMSDLIRYFFVNTLVVLLALIAFYTLKKQMVTSVRLEAALQKVIEQSEQLKGLAVVEERNRIAMEMHDTVGHKLTAAVITLEAAEDCIRKQPQMALQKVQMSKEQVRQGLSELRSSVRVLRAGGETDFDAALRRLTKEIQFDTGLEFHIIIDTKIGMPPTQAGILLSSIKECATNAIKHGHASQADILLGEHKGQLRLTFTDNGCGSSDWRPGSGLTIMRERIQSIGGTLKTESIPGEGFTVNLTIPVPQITEEVQ